MTPSKAVTAATVGTVAVALFANNLLAVPIEWAFVLGLPLGGLVLLGVLLTGASDANWEPAPAPTFAPAELHASTLAARFAEAAEDHHRFTSRVQPRLRRLAVARLRARAGTEDLTSLDDPRARQALSPELHRLLTDRHARLPEPRRLAALLDELEGS
jgi:hypothetical protein